MIEKQRTKKKEPSNGFTCAGLHFSIPIAHLADLVLVETVVEYENFCCITYAMKRAKFHTLNVRHEEADE